MTRAATVADLEALRLAKESRGAVVHRGCEPRIIYTLTRDAFLCTDCQQTWYRRLGRDSIYVNPVIDAEVQE